MIFKQIKKIFLKYDEILHFRNQPRKWISSKKNVSVNYSPETINENIDKALKEAEYWLDRAEYWYSIREDV